jgi:hypothetical protein
VFFNVSTTAGYDGTIRVCVGYNDADVLGDESSLVLMHWNGTLWVDVTDPPVDTVGNIVCGISDLLSPFCVMEPLMSALTATVEVNPRTLNLKSRGKWVTAYIELPAGYDPEEVDVSTVIFEGTIPAEALPTDVGDFDEDGTPDRMVKFDRASVQAQLSPGDEVTMSIEGSLTDGTAFSGMDTIRVR